MPLGMQFTVHVDLDPTPAVCDLTAALEGVTFTEGAINALTRLALAERVEAGDREMVTELIAAVEGFQAVEQAPEGAC